MTMDTTNTSRYQDVQFQSKTGTLMISGEKVVFRPKLDKTPPPGTKATSRSWRWAAIDRVEVMDPARGCKHRSIKLKSNSADGKAVTLKVPNDILDAVLMDIRNRLGSRLSIEGPVQRTSHVDHKKPLPEGMRRRSMTSAGSQRSLAIKKTTPRRSSMAASPATSSSLVPRNNNNAQQQNKKDNHATKEQARRASMLATRRNKPQEEERAEAVVVTTKKEEPVPVPVQEEPSVVEEEVWNLDDQSEVKKTDSDGENNNRSNGLRSRLKPKYPLIKPQGDKYRQVPESPKEEAKQGLLSGEKKTTPTTKRGFLGFMKSPTGNANKRGSTANEDEIAAMEQKAREQEARILEQQRKHQEREAALLARRYSLNKRRGSIRTLASPKTPSPQIQSKPKVVNPAAFPPPQVYRPGPPSVFAPGDLEDTNNNNNNNSSKNNEIVFNPAKPTNTHNHKKPDEDETSRTSASSSPDSPNNHKEEAKDTFPEVPENNAALWNPDAPENKFRIMILHHAATCQMTNGCPYDPICCEYRNVLKHIETCSDDECRFQHCKATRDFLLTMRLMTSSGGDDRLKTNSGSNKDFLIGMGAIAPVPVIHVGDIQSQKGDWDAFSAVSNSTWWEKAGS